MTLSYLNYQQARQLLSWPEAVQALRAGHLLPKAQIHDVLIGPEDALLLNRTARIEGMGYGVKAESVFRANTARGLPASHGVVLVYAQEHGMLRGVIDSHAVTDLKTVADSLLAASLLARPDSRHCVIVGAGRVAANLAQAYCALFPGLEKISIWARRPEQAQALAAQLQTLAVPVAAVSDLPAACATADMISSATPSRQPVLSCKWLRSGTHVDLIGAFTPEMREADDELIARASLYVDSRETTRHVGEIVMPIASGAAPPDHVRGDLYDLVAGSGPAPGGITVFKNGGGAHLDLMIADRMLQAIGK